MWTRTRVVLAIAVAVVLVGSTGAIAATQFRDVDDSNVHADAVEWASENGITSGCNDDGDFCPSDFARRDQIARLLQRLAGHDPEVAPVVDAATVEGLTADDLRGRQGPAGPPGPPGPAHELEGDDGEVLTIEIESSVDVRAPGRPDDPPVVGVVEVLPIVVTPDGSVLVDELALVTVEAGFGTDRISVPYRATFEVPDPRFGAYTVGIAARRVTGGDTTSINFDTRAVSSRDGVTTRVPGVGWGLPDDVRIQLMEEFVYAPGAMP